MPTESSEMLKVLVADDSPIYRKLIERTLAGRHYDLLFAKTGNEALRHFAEHLPPILITDWMMPDLTGLELCKTIRNTSKDFYTYTVVLTSNSEKGSVVKALESGADDFLTKPFDSDELLARVGVGRRVAGLRRQLEAKNRLLAELALTDSLTGLPNRRAVEDWTVRQLNSATRHDFPLWVVMADLDHFKVVNDTYGHAVGDAVIKEFAAILKANVRSSDICARIGGEEFVMVLSHSDLKGVLVALDRVRTQVEACEFKVGDKKTSITASFGVSGVRGKEGVDFPSLLAQADEALYAAKSLGRNRVEVAEKLAR